MVKSNISSTHSLYSLPMSPKPMHILLGFIILIAPVTLSLADPAYNSKLDVKHDISNISHYNISNNQQLIRWKVGEDTYFGQTIVDGQKGLGVVTGGGTYVYSINHEMLSLTIRF